MKLLAIAFLSAVIPVFAQQVNVNVSTPQTLNLPQATATQTGLLSSQDWVTFNAKQSATGKFPWAQLTGVPTLQPVLGFVPENPANKNKTNGYLGADANGNLPWAQISNIPTASATTFGCLKPSDWSAFNAKVGLDASGLIPGNLITWSHISNIPNASAAVRGALSSADWIVFNSKQSALGYTPENPVNRDQPKGYPSLDANGKIPSGELPLTPVQVWNEVYQVPAVPVATYALLNANVTGVSVVAYKNRARQIVNTDYSVNGNVVTFLPLPNVGDVFVFDYQHQ